MWMCVNCGHECEMDEFYCPNCAQDRVGYIDGVEINSDVKNSKNND